MGGLHHRMRRAVAGVGGGGGGGVGIYDITNLSYDSIASPNLGDCSQFAFKPNGALVVTLSDVAGADAFRSYPLSTPWDVSTINAATYTDSPALPTSSAFAFWMHPDGLKCWLMGYNSLNIWEYTLSTAWDVSTATNTAIGTVANQYPYGLSFSSDGAYFFVCDWFKAASIYRYSMSTPWDVTTASSAGNSGLTGSKRAIALTPDGTKAIFADDTLKELYQYNLSTLWDVTQITGAADVTITDPTPITTNIEGITFKDPLGEKVFLASGNVIYRYSLS